MSKLRNHWLSAVVSTVSTVVFALGVASVASAKKPTPLPPPAPATGTIVFEYNGQTWEMNANDGSAKTLLASRLVENPSSDTYAGLRWELVTKETGEFYQIHQPDGTVATLPQRDLFARAFISDELGNVEIQLTNFYGSRVVSKAHWGRSDAVGVDAFISAYVTDISDAVIGMDGNEIILLGSGTGENIAGDYSVVGRLQVTGEEIISITSPASPDDPRWQTVLTTSKHLYWHAWSPDGQYLAYYTTNPDGIYVVDISNSPVTHEDSRLIPVTDDAIYPDNPYAWSPDSSTILYRRASAIRAVNPFTLQYDVLLDYSSVDGTPQNAQWSTDGAQIVYLIEKQVLRKYYFNIARTRVSDGATVKLTGDLDQRLSKDVYLWTE